MVREDEYLRLRAAEEDLEDVRLYDEAKAKPSEFIPLELTERMLNGENPIRVYREYRGFTRDQLGAQAGISKPFLSQIENGIRTPSHDTVKRLAEVLRVDMDDLVWLQRLKRALNKSFLMWYTHISIAPIFNL